MRGLLGRWIRHWLRNSCQALSKTKQNKNGIIGFTYFWYDALLFCAGCCPCTNLPDSFVEKQKGRVAKNANSSLQVRDKSRDIIIYLIGDVLF